MQNGGRRRRPGGFHHVICSTADVMDFRHNSLSIATEKLENLNNFQRRGKSYL